MKLQPGCIIQTNETPGGVPFVVRRVFETNRTLFRVEPGAFSLECGLANNARGGSFWFHGYHYVGDRILGHRHRPGTTGFSSNGGGRDGDGYDEIIVLRWPDQPALDFD